MSQTTITSRDNELARRARRTRDGKEAEHIFIEGLRLSEEAVNSNLQIEDIIYTQKFSDIGRGAKLLHSLRARAKRIALADEKVFASISDTKSPQGIAIIARRPPTDLDAFAPRQQNNQSLLVIMHGINNPSNAGAMLRVAEAVGVGGVIATFGSTDLFSPKALRGAMGSSFRLPLWTGAQFREAVAWCKSKNLKIICADLTARQTHVDVKWNEACALVFGSEADGLTSDEIALADELVKIPMRPPVESLNVATACAVVLFEAQRQRGW
ncbi:MAG: RNA methyltransferase [Pyrinomonadaceae bacterium]|nr:RNA methyltransferase [Pyrinomonadaceae bacterium]